MLIQIVAVYGHRADGHRTIQKNRKHRNSPGLLQLTEKVEDALAPSHGKGGNNQASTRLDGLLYKLLQIGPNIHLLVSPATVGGFKKQEIRLF